MRIAAKRVLSVTVITIIILSLICATCFADGNSYCRNCGRQIPADSNYCPYCGTQVLSGINGNSSSGYVFPKTVVSSFKRSERTVTDYFKNSYTNYNVFPYEMTNCYGVHFFYSATTAGTSKEPCTGVRDFYIRDMQSELNDDDRGWIYVGSFSYNTEGEAVEVNLQWQPMNVYAAAVIRRDTGKICSYSASWGDRVNFYSYNYSSPYAVQPTPAPVFIDDGWSGWSSYPVQATATRQVETRQIITGYNMTVYVTQEDSDSHHYRDFRDFSIGGNYGLYNARKSYGEKHFTLYVTEDQIAKASVFAPGEFVPDSNPYVGGYNRSSKNAYVIPVALDSQGRYYPLFIDNAVTETQYRYKDR